MLQKNIPAGNDFAATLVRIILQSMSPENRAQFIHRLTTGVAADVQVILYDFVCAMICSWAGKSDLSDDDAAVIEDCRKICDVMGWLPEMGPKD